MGGSYSRWLTYDSTQGFFTHSIHWILVRASLNVSSADKYTVAPGVRHSDPRANHGRNTRKSKSLETRAHDILGFMRSLRNMLLPANRLPPEIISSTARCILDTRSIFSLTHVYRYWRDSIISSSDSWTLIFSEWKDLAALSLERAKACGPSDHPP